MTLHRVSRILLAVLATLGVALSANMLGYSVEQFLAGVFSGGLTTAAYLSVRDRIQ